MRSTDARDLSRPARRRRQRAVLGLVGLLAVTLATPATAGVRAAASSAKKSVGLNPSNPTPPAPWAKICGKRIGRSEAFVAGADNCRWLTVDGQTRRYIAYIPPGKGPWPVVFMFHGGGQTGEQHHEISGWRPLAEREKFIAVFPTGLNYLESGGDVRPRWNDFSMPCEVAPKPADWPAGQQYPADDTRFVDQMLVDISAQTSVDARRIFASGFSNGSAFTKTLGLTRTKTFAAVGSWAGSIAECELNGSVVREAIAPHLQNPPAAAIPTAWGIGAADPHMLDPYNKARVAQGLAPAKNLPVTLDFVNSAAGQKLIRSQEEVESNGLVFGPATPVDVTTWPGIGAPASDYVSARWAQPAPGNTAGNDYSFMFLKDVGHNYPNATKGNAHRIKDSNGVNAAEVFWHFFLQHPKK